MELTNLCIDELGILAVNKKVEVVVTSKRGIEKSDSYL